MKVAELREMAQSLGIDSASLCKQQLVVAIKQLREQAAHQLGNGIDGEAQNESDNEEAEVNSGDDEQNGDDTSSLDIGARADTRAKDSSATLGLKLKLKMVEAEKAGQAAKLKLTRDEWQIRKERFHLFDNRGVKPAVKGQVKSRAARNGEGYRLKCLIPPDEVHPFYSCV